ncbi:hypothetical protein J1605_011270 [Eschrichtius robustus]|uniref:Gastrokine-1 n=1 Tax=Eschrichtius robustus TaxID=9764 RepID=A0AB34GLT1_ESCRO|nr:hypothetical protein J1605_011270 [Eschrichtius robustus]
MSISCKFQNINVNNSGGSGQQSVSVNNEHNVANVDNNNGWDSWNSVWDYESGFAVTRLFNKKSCIVHKMNKAVMPSLQALDTLVKEKKLQGKGLGEPPSKSLIYTVNPDKVDNLDQFGKSIVAMCKGIPTYMAEEIQAHEVKSNTFESKFQFFFTLYGSRAHNLYSLKARGVKSHGTCTALGSPLKENDLRENRCA